MLNAGEYRNERRGWEFRVQFARRCPGSVPGEGLFFSVSFAGLKCVDGGCPGDGIGWDRTQISGFRKGFYEEEGIINMA